MSNVTLEGLELALEHVEVAEVQNAYSVIDRTDEPLVDRCAELGIPYVAFFPLGSAFAGGPARLAADAAIAVVASGTVRPRPRSRSPGCLRGMTGCC